MANHPYKRRKQSRGTKPVAPGIDQYVTDMQGLEREPDQDGQCVEATEPDHERGVMYEPHATPKPVIVTRKRRWSALEKPD